MEQIGFGRKQEEEIADSIYRCVQYMAVSARTAPKAKGEDCIGIKIIAGQELESLADAMIDYGRKTGKTNFDRDGENVRNSTAVLLISLYDSKPIGANCGACGEINCSALKTAEGSEFDGPLCAFRILDLGIAIGSAVKTASLFNLDNRIMYRIGVVAKNTGLLTGQLVLGIPVSATGKNIYFDRKA